MNNAAFNKPVKGAYTQLEQLLSTRLLAKKLSLKYPSKVLSRLSGDYQSPFRGRGLDFSEVRSYHAGDDIRTIDWRVTARTGKTHTKIFTEERERPTLIAVDQRHSLFFGSQYCFKSVLACHVAAIIAWASLQQGDRVGGMVLGEQNDIELRPKRSRHSVLNFLHHLVEYNHALQKNNYGNDSNVNHDEQVLSFLQKIHRSAKPGTCIYLITDGNGLTNESCKKWLYTITRHCQIIVINVFDPLEQQLPKAGLYSISNGDKHHLINTGPKKFRQHYAQQFIEQQNKQQQLLLSLGIPMISISTCESPFNRLQLFFS